jgi:hypothetical protein
LNLVSLFFFVSQKANYVFVLRIEFYSRDPEVQDTKQASFFGNVRRFDSQRGSALGNESAQIAYAVDPPCIICHFDGRAKRNTNWVLREQEE